MGDRGGIPPAANVPTVRATAAFAVASLRQHVSDNWPDEATSIRS